MPETTRYSRPPACYFPPYPRPVAFWGAVPQAELAPGLALLGPVDEKFVEVREVCEPLEDGAK